MTRVSCPDCRLRFTPAEAACLPACPTCGGALQTLSGPAGAVGFRLYQPDNIPHSLPDAVAVAIPIPGPRAGRS